MSWYNYVPTIRIYNYLNFKIEKILGAKMHVSYLHYFDDVNE